MIGKLITSLLTANTALIELVPKTSVYPYVINENTLLPAIIYTIDSLETGYDKDGWVGDICTFSVVSFSDNYSALQNIVLQVRSSLELVKGTIEGITIDRIELEGLTEGYSIAENCFLNKLTFSARITQY